MTRTKLNGLRNDLSVEITPATREDEPVLLNLYQLYIHDFTDFVERSLGNDGRFDYDPLPPYWSDPDRFPFLVWVDRKLAGFALVKKGSDFSGDPEVRDMADFFIVRGVRRNGVAIRWQRTFGINFLGDGKFVL